MSFPTRLCPTASSLGTVRTAADFHKRVALHRAVWAPSRLTEEGYRKVTSAWPYRADLDCVVEAPDGSFAAYVLSWFDEENGVGEFEPGRHASRLPAARPRGSGVPVRLEAPAGRRRTQRDRDGGDATRTGVRAPCTEHRLSPALASDRVAEGTSVTLAFLQNPHRPADGVALDLPDPVWDLRGRRDHSGLSQRDRSDRDRDPGCPRSVVAPRR